MKTDIHPTYYPKATVKCSCGAVHTIGSTREKMTVEICSECHPFYTGKEKLVDTAGRVERFKARKAKASDTKAKKKTDAHKRVIKKTTVGKLTPRKKSKK